MNRFVNLFTMYEERSFFFFNKKMRSHILDLIMPKITHMGGATFTISLLAMLLIFSGDLVQSWSVQAFIALSTSHIIVHFVKKTWVRQRPYNHYKNVNLATNPLKDYSFPSGHTTAAFSIACTFCINMPILTLILLPIAIMIGLSRMYIGLHYPTDVLIGAMLGIVSAILVTKHYHLFSLLFS